MCAKHGLKLILLLMVLAIVQQTADSKSKLEILNAFKKKFGAEVGKEPPSVKVADGPDRLTLEIDSHIRINALHDKTTELQKSEANKAKTKYRKPEASSHSHSSCSSITIVRKPFFFVVILGIVIYLMSTNL